MRVWPLRFSPAAAAWMAMTLVASAAPLTSEVEIPTGDVWIMPEAPTPTPAQTARRTPVQRQLPTGDFWPAEDDATRAADALPCRVISPPRARVMEGDRRVG